MRGLCTECAVDLERGLACKERCEQDVRALVRSVSVAKSVGSFGVFFFIAAGIVMTLWGYSTSHTFWDFQTALGGIFLVMGHITTGLILYPEVCWGDWSELCWAQDIPERWIAVSAGVLGAVCFGYCSGRWGDPSLVRLPGSCSPNLNVAFLNGCFILRSKSRWLCEAVPAIGFR
jgi:hypothetical protein